MTLQELLDECKNDINSEVAFQKILAEHDAEIRADVIEEFFKACEDRNSFYIPMTIIMDIAEQLKEQK